MVTVRNDIESYVMTSGNTGTGKVKDVNLQQEVTKRSRKRSYRCVAVVASAVVALLLVGIGSILLYEHLLGDIPETDSDASPRPKDETSTTTTSSTTTETVRVETVQPETEPPVFINPYEDAKTDDPDLIDIDQDESSSPTVDSADKDGRDDDDDDDDDDADVSSGSGSGDSSYY